MKKRSVLAALSSSVILLSASATFACPECIESRLGALENKVDSMGKFTLAPGPTFTQGYHSFFIKGTVTTDYTMFDQDNTVQTNGFNMRNARFGFGGEIFRDWFYMLEANFANGSVGLTSAFMGYKFTPRTKIYFGQLDAPFSMEEQMSSRWTTFMERGSLNVFVPGLNMGAMLENSGKNYSIVAGFFGDGTGTAPADDEALKFAARATWAPYLNGDKVVHFGIAGDYETPDQDTHILRYMDRPEARIGAIAVDTGNITSVNNAQFWGVEFAMAGNGLSFQSEYVGNIVNRKGLADSRFNGGYAFVTWTLTGETRQYDGSSGTFGRVSPKNPLMPNQNGWGAWELAARYNFINLKSGAINGGSQHNWAVALNWYPNDYVKLSANAIFANINPGTTTLRDNPNVYMVRAQVGF